MKEEAKGKAKGKPQKDKHVKLVQGRVHNGTSQWIRCTFDWNILSHAHLASTQWGSIPGYIIPGLKDQLHKRRQLIGKDLNPIYKLPQSTVPEKLEPLLKSVVSTLDQLHVNWYLGFGAEVGFLRSQAFIPWDEDVDLVVKMADRIRVCDFIKEGDIETEGVGSGNFSAFRSVPDHPEWLMVAYYHSETICHKVLWIDITTEVAIDMCIDCDDAISDSDVFVPTKRALFGDVEVNVPAHPFDSSIQKESGVDRDLEQISMKTAGCGWMCTRYECGAEPPTGTSAASLEDVYSTNASAMQGPFDFHIDGPTSLHTTAQCSLPRSFHGCSAEDSWRLPLEVYVRPCQDSPWASSASTPFTLMESAFIENEHVAKYQVSRWMVVPLQ